MGTTTFTLKIANNPNLNEESEKYGKNKEKNEHKYISKYDLQGEAKPFRGGRGNRGGRRGGRGGRGRGGVGR